MRCQYCGEKLYRGKIKQIEFGKYLKYSLCQKCDYEAILILKQILELFNKKCILKNVSREKFYKTLMQGD